VLTAEEVSLVLSTEYFGSGWINRKGQPCCVAALAMKRGVKFTRNKELKIFVADNYDKLYNAAEDIARWLGFVHEDKPQYIELFKALKQCKRKVFKRALY
jgi:hypothetical protein